MTHEGICWTIIKTTSISKTYKHHYGPTKYTPPEYGKKIKYNTEDKSPELNPIQKNHIQKVCGKVPYNRQSVNSTQLHSLNELSIKATTATEIEIEIEETQEVLIQFCNYCASNPDAPIIYQANGMILSCDSDTAYFEVEQEVTTTLATKKAHNSTD